MSRVITFSRVYPSYHPKAGQPTHFVEKIHYNIWGQCPDKWIDAQSMLMDLNKHLPKGIVHDFIESLEMEFDFNDLSKGHTIRAGHRWKVGDWFSPRVWSGKPYNSKQIIIAPDIQVKRVWDIGCRINGYKQFYSGDTDLTGNSIVSIARNDGLTSDDLYWWFNKPFTGQIICWDESIEY